MAIRQLVRPLPRLGVLEEDVLEMRVGLNDIDLNLHLNNARYMNLMDYARAHMLARTLLLDRIVKKRWMPVLGAAWMTYRRSLPVFERYTIGSRIVGWDEKWFYMEHTFTGKKGVAAVGWVKGILVDKRGNVEPQRVIDPIEPGLVSPPLPEVFHGWNDLTREKLHEAFEAREELSS